MLIKAYSGDYTKNHDDSFVVLPSNLVYYRYKKLNCYCLATVNIKFHLSRVLGVRKDFIEAAISPGTVKLIINPLYFLSRFKLSQSDYLISL